MESYIMNTRWGVWDMKKLGRRQVTRLHHLTGGNNNINLRPVLSSIKLSQKQRLLTEYLRTLIYHINCARLLTIYRLSVTAKWASQPIWEKIFKVEKILLILYTANWKDTHYWLRVHLPMRKAKWKTMVTTLLQKIREAFFQTSKFTV